jgi:hypothetical protein
VVKDSSRAWEDEVVQVPVRAPLQLSRVPLSPSIDFRPSAGYQERTTEQK